MSPTLGAVTFRYRLDYASHPVLDLARSIIMAGRIQSTRASIHNVQQYPAQQAQQEQFQRFDILFDPTGRPRKRMNDIRPGRNVVAMHTEDRHQRHADGQVRIHDGIAHLTAIARNRR